MPTRKAPTTIRAQFAHPSLVSDAQKAFPAQVVDTFLPPQAWYIQDRVPRQWRDFVDAIFFGHGVEDIGLIPKQDVDPALAWRHATMCLGSFEPQHEHKTEGVAWLLWNWFESGTYTTTLGQRKRTHVLAQTGEIK